MVGGFFVHLGTAEDMCKLLRTVQVNVINMDTSIATSKEFFEVMSMLKRNKKTPETATPAPPIEPLITGGFTVECTAAVARAALKAYQEGRLQVALHFVFTLY